MAHDLSQQGLALAERCNRAGVPDRRDEVLCYTTLYFGRLTDAADLDRAVPHAVSRVPRRAADVSGAAGCGDRGPGAAARRSRGCWATRTAAEDAIRDGLAHVERLDRDFDRALLHAWIAGTRYTQRRYDEAEAHADKAVAISQQHGYREWLGTGMLLLLMAQCALQPSASAMEQATAVCLGFEREGVGLNASYYLWGLARGYAQLGELDKARFSLAKAFQCAQASAESRMNPELMILQAELESDRAVATRLLDDALALAETQGAVATALRAAATLVLRTNADPADAGEARATLDLLDCRECYPAEPGWMRARLDALRAARNLRPTAA